MSRSFIGFGQVPYIGVLQPFPNPLAPGAYFIPAFFNWTAYGASTANSNINVLCDMMTAPRLKDTWRIRSVYIDNYNSSVPIYVYFPDSGFTVAAEPNSATWYPVLTNSRVAWVIGEGFNTGNIPNSIVYFSDVILPPYTDLEFEQAAALYLASAAITRGTTIYNTSFGIPALGDQTRQTVLPLQVAPATVGLLLTPLPAGFVYLTALHLNVVNCSNAPGVRYFTFFIESTGPSGILFQFDCCCGSGVSTIPLVPIIKVADMDGMQIKLVATETWQLRFTIAGGGLGLSVGSAELSLNYTLNNR